MPNEQNQIAVAAILKEVGLSLDFKDKSDRLEIQKAIYLSQASGAHLSYWFNWYLNGPYSSSLADDYYEAKTRLDDLSKYSASEGLRKKLVRVRNLIHRKPEWVGRADWLEAVASLDYMRRVQRRPESELAKACEKEKPRLKDILDPALEALKQEGFLD
jgi:hypothetical protein